MEVWGMIGVYMLALLLLQFLAYRYVRARESEGDRPGDAGPDGSPEGRLGYPLDGRAARVDRTASIDPDTDETESSDQRRCPRCGTVNERDTVFVYCRDCGGRLAGY